MGDAPQRPAVLFASALQTEVVPTGFVARLMQWFNQTLAAKEDADVDFGHPLLVQGTAVTHLVRNELMLLFMRHYKRFSHLLMCDCDMVWPENAISRLVAHGKPIVSGRCHMRTPPYFVTALQEMPDGHLQSWSAIGRDVPSDGLHQVDAVGGAFLLIEREVVEKMEGGWFDPYPGMSEDISFCVRARNEYGFEVYCDFGCHVGHLAMVPITPRVLIDPAGRPEMPPLGG